VAVNGRDEIWNNGTPSSREEFIRTCPTWYTMRDSATIAGRILTKLGGGGYRIGIMFHWSRRRGLCGQGHNVRDQI